MQRSFASQSPIPVVVAQHVEESTILRRTRAVLVRASHVKLKHLSRWDERIAAHLDGVAVAGEFGWKLCEAGLENSGVGEVFVAAVRAIQDKNSQRLDRLIVLVEAIPQSESGLSSAFGWVSSQSLKGMINLLLSADNLFRRRVGIIACALHRVDPGSALGAAIKDKDSALRARAIRAAGELGRLDLLPICQQYIRGDDSSLRFWAAWSATLLGDRREAVEALKVFIPIQGVFRERTLRLALKVVEPKNAHGLLKELAQDPANQRELIRGTGIAGDPFYILWLIKQMSNPQIACLAGEAFSFITGLDLAYQKLEQEPPADFEPGPNDDPNDDNVAMDEDDGLPWPDPVKIQAWWSANSHRFQSGVCYFMGEPVTRAHCIRVLKEGYQRQRIAAAEYLCLLNPGTPLFNTSAPAWRQKRLLEKME